MLQLLTLKYLLILISLLFVPQICQCPMMSHEVPVTLHNKHIPVSRSILDQTGAQGVVFSVCDLGVMLITSYIAPSPHEQV